MKEMARVLNNLKESLAEDRKSLNYMLNVEIEHRDVDIFIGRIEAFEYAIKQIEEAMEQSQRIEAVNSMTNYLLTGDRGTHGTKESN